MQSQRGRDRDSLVLSILPPFRLFQILCLSRPEEEKKGKCRWATAWALQLEAVRPTIGQKLRKLLRRATR